MQVEFGHVKMKYDVNMRKRIHESHPVSNCAIRK